MNWRFVTRLRVTVSPFVYSSNNCSTMYITLAGPIHSLNQSQKCEKKGFVPSMLSSHPENRSSGSRISDNDCRNVSALNAFSNCRHILSNIRVSRCQTAESSNKLIVRVIILIPFCFHQNLNSIMISLYNSFNSCFTKYSSVDHFIFGFYPLLQSFNPCVVGKA